MMIMMMKNEERYESAEKRGSAGIQRSLSFMATLSVMLACFLAARLPKLIREARAAA